MQSLFLYPQFIFAPKDYIIRRWLSHGVPLVVWPQLSTLSRNLPVDPGVGAARRPEAPYALPEEGRVNYNRSAIITSFVLGRLVQNVCPSNIPTLYMCVGSSSSVVLISI